MLLQNSTVSGNTEFIGSGGVLYNTGDATITDCTFSDNTAGAPTVIGGAIENTGTLNLIDSTLAQNNGNGFDNHAAATISDCTIAGNTELGCDSEAGSLTMANTIVTGGNFSVAGPIDSLGHNLIGAADQSTGWLGSDLTGSFAQPLDAKLSPLANYGGTMQTLFPRAGSPAIGGGSVVPIPTGVSTDQRGFPRTSLGQADIGAVQLPKTSSLQMLGPPAKQVIAGISTAMKLGSFIDAGGKGPYQVAVEWGDGSPESVYSISNVGLPIVESHAAANLGTFTASVHVVDSLGAISNLASFTLNATPNATYVVNTTVDQEGFIGGKTLSLRGAIDQAANTIGSSTINVPAGHYELTLGELSISPSANIVSINGIGGPAIIDAMGQSRVLLINLGVVADLNELSIINGSVKSDGISVSSGAGIYNDGTLYLRDSTISGNTSTDGSGGGLFNTHLATVTGCTFDNNGADTSDSNSTVNGLGGAIENIAELTLVESTISGNGSRSGGSVDNHSLARVRDCTIYGDGQYGIDNISGSLTVGNTVVLDSGNDVGGVITSLGHNLVGYTDRSSGWLASDLTNIPYDWYHAIFAPLGEYGGRTKTMPPLPGNPAIGGGLVSLIPPGSETDQRGFARTQMGKIDIGAVELQAAHVVTITPPPSMQQAVAGVTTPVQLGLFTDPGGIGPFSVHVSWQDGSPDSLFSLRATGSIQTSHAFIYTGTLTGTVYIYDSSGDLSNFSKFSVSSSAAPAIALVVNSTKDVVDSTSGKTVTFRDAINQASASFGPVSITFDPNIFSRPQTIILSGQALELHNNVFGLITITGPAAGVTLNANNASGVMAVDVGVSAAISNLSLIDGNNPGLPSSYNPVYYAGGVANRGTLTISHCSISGNTAYSTGGIFNSGYMTLTNSVIEDNSTDAYQVVNSGGSGGGICNTNMMTISACTISGNRTITGGGIYNRGSLAITGSTISDNVTTPAEYIMGFGRLGGQGSGIESGGTLTITNSVISGNSSIRGNAIDAYYANLLNCTISGNSSGISTMKSLTLTGCSIFGNGGTGVAIQGSATLVNSTICNNSGVGVTSDFGVTTISNCTISGNVGGIENYGARPSGYASPIQYGPLTVADTIISGNYKWNTPGNPYDASGKMISLGHNLIGQTDGSVGWIATDLTGTAAHPLDAKLSSLSEFGGPTLTEYPLPGSPASWRGINRAGSGSHYDRPARLRAGKWRNGRYRRGGNGTGCRCYCRASAHANRGATKAQVHPAWIIQ